MRNVQRAILLLIFTSLLMTGCTLFTGKELPPSGIIVAADDFSVDTGDWQTGVNSDHSMIGYQVDGLRFVINDANRDYISLYKHDYNNAILDVDVQKLWGPDDNIMGIICRYQDVNNHYSFLISTDGYYGIAATIDGQTQVLSDEQLSFNEEVIYTDGSVNHIRAGCVGDSLWLEINGHSLAGVDDDTFSEGSIGLVAGALNETGVDVLFDNFSVIQP